jgi:tetratricopeptide (TPR) repeat protein
MSQNDVSGFVHGNVVQAGSVGQIVYAGERLEFPVPSQLPPLPRHFTRRQQELATMGRWLRDDPDQLLLTVISGTAGVGKTMLAVRWLSDTSARYPDGQLYVDLGGFSRTGPVDPEDVLEWFLVALGLPTARIPDGLPQRVALYRSMTARRDMSVLLDNAFSAAQVTALLPSSPRSAVVVTSRWRLAGLRVDGARFLDLGPLDLGDSVALLDSVVGDRRTEAEADDAEELARLCGGLPIALSVVGARLFARPHRSLRDEVAEIKDKDRLAALDMDDEVTVSGIFDLSYETLPPDAARLYRLCALHPGSVFGLDIAAAIVDQPAAEAGAAAYSLVERNLLVEVADRRFRYHDLVALHARELAERTDDEHGRTAAVRRMVEWYLDGTVAADRTVRPTRRRVGPRFQSPPTPVFSGRQDALRWLVGERHNLLLAVRTAEEHEWHDLVWEFCEALWTLVSYAPGDWAALYRSGVVAAHRCEHAVAETRIRILLGSTLTAQRRYDEAVEEITRALRQAEETGNRFSTATALFELASAWQGKDEPHIALDHLRRAKQIREAIDTTRTVTQCQRQIGILLTDLGRYDEAVTELRPALDTLPTSDLERARVLVALGVAHLRAHRIADARPALAQAVVIATELGSDLRRADAFTALGELELGQSNVPVAREHLIAAKDLYETLGNPSAEDLTARLAHLPER